MLTNKHDNSLVCKLEPVTMVSLINMFVSMRRREVTLAFKAPHRGLESSFCCRIAGQRLAQRQCMFSHTPVCYGQSTN